MKTIIFYLVPDKFCAHYVRKQLARKNLLLGVQIGTWPELLELAGNCYCLPLQDDKWQEKIEAEINNSKSAFWQKSCSFDPEVTTLIISRALSELLWGVNSETEIKPAVTSQLSPRSKKQLDDLLALKERLGDTLPTNLALTQKLLNCDENQAIRTIRVHHIPFISNLNRRQSTLVHHLNKHADKISRIGSTTDCKNIEKDFAELLSWPPPVKDAGGLRHLQQNLFTESNKQQKSRSGLQWLSARDYLQEVEVAAGMIQKIIADPDTPAHEIGLLLPESADYTQAAAEIFAKAGIPLSGLSKSTNSRDLGRELLYQFILNRKAHSPAPMLRAALFASPLLPWFKTADQIAQKIMDGRPLASIFKNLPEEEQKTGYLLAGKELTEPKKLVKSLRGLMAAIGNSKAEKFSEQRQKALALIHELLPLIDQNSDKISWEPLLRICRPKYLLNSETTEINREGVRVFHPEREPWQPVKHLLLLGFADGNYPQTAQLHPVIHEEDRLILESHKILLPTRALLIEQRRSRFLRQLRAASQSITFFIPKLDNQGKHCKPSSTQGFMAQLFAGVKSGEGLLLDLNQAANWPQIEHLARAQAKTPIPPRKLVSDTLELKENLLRKRKNSQGETASESPSGLGTLMVSPLAWLFKRYKITSHEWESAGLDASITGSIAHEIFEHLFNHQDPLPQKEKIPEKVEALFQKVAGKDFPFLLQDEWQLECRQMIKDFTKAAVGWLDFLTVNRLKILGEETNLTGEFNGCQIRGKADLICAAANDKLLVVDYKTSKSHGRQKVMEKSYDYQASLYCQMLELNKLPDDIPVALKKKLNKSPQTSALYYTLRDQVTLSDSSADFLNGSEIIEGNIAQKGLDLIKQRMDELCNGRVTLNTEDDSDWFNKETGVTPYALDESPLISLFMKEGDES